MSVMSPVTEQSAWHAHESHWPGRVDQPMEEIQILSTVVHQIAEGVLITDREGLIEYVNPAFERLTGYSRHEVLGRKPGILKSGRQDPAVDDALARLRSVITLTTRRLVNRAVCPARLG